MRILLTGFEPFGGSPINPSASLIEVFAAEGLLGSQVTTAILPVVGGSGSQSARAGLERAIAACEPETVVCFGEASRATHVQFERVGVNLRDDRIADNAGRRCCDEPIIADAPVAYFSTLPMRAMRDACEGEGVPAELSMSAGTFLCNEVLYWLLHACATRLCPSVSRAGFVHLPQLPEQAAVRGGPSMKFQHVIRGVRASLRELASPLG